MAATIMLLFYQVYHLVNFLEDGTGLPNLIPSSVKRSFESEMAMVRSHHASD
jgi:hypothetical protein